MISITSEKSSVQSSQSTVDQVYQVHEAEALHIVSETTSREQSESRREPKASSPINTTTPSLQDTKGRQYLHWILKLILPYALYRTWSRAVSFQAPGNTCYVGAAGSPRQEKVGDAKLRLTCRNWKRED